MWWRRGDNGLARHLRMLLVAGVRTGMMREHDERRFHRQMRRLIGRVERAVVLLARSDGLVVMTRRLLTELTPRRTETRWLRDNWQQQRPEESERPRA
jgi:hypothetical protein